MRDTCYRCHEPSDPRRSVEYPGEGTRYLYECSQGHEWWLGVTLDGTVVGKLSVHQPEETGGTTWSLQPVPPWDWSTIRAFSGEYFLG